LHHHIFNDSQTTRQMNQSLLSAIYSVCSDWPDSLSCLPCTTRRKQTPIAI